MTFAEINSAVTMFERFAAVIKRGLRSWKARPVTSVSQRFVRKVRIIETPLKEAEVSDQINRDSLAEIAEMNRTSGLLIISAGQGYEPEHIAEVGTDVTLTFIRRPGIGHGQMKMDKNMIKKLFVGSAVVMLLSGCAGMEAYNVQVRQGKTSAVIGCSPKDIAVEMTGVDTWTATCRQKVFHCKIVPGVLDTSAACAPALQ